MPAFSAIVGLGNPGGRYRPTRHNVGFRTVEHLARRSGIALSTRRFRALVGRGLVAERQAMLALPQTFMNLSGEAVAPLLGYFRIEPADLIVVHDDVDLDFGRLKVKRGGGAGGHRGLLSLVEHLGSNEFCRVRIGIGRPETDQDVRDWVLSPFGPDQEQAVGGVLDRATEAVELILREGIACAMNRFNMRTDEDRQAESDEE